MTFPKVPAWAWGTFLALSLAALQILVGKVDERRQTAVSTQEQPEELEEEAPCPAGTLPDDGVCLPVPSIRTPSDAPPSAAPSLAAP